MQCLRSVTARSASSSGLISRQCVQTPVQFCAPRSFSTFLLRPTLSPLSHSRTSPSSSPNCIYPTSPSTSPNSITTTQTSALASKISLHPAMASIASQVRFGPRNTMHGATHLIRKRRFGFLARVRSRTGKKILDRRRAKGRRSLTH